MIEPRKVCPRKQWFLDRIGKRVFRNKTSCPCPSCERISSEGLIIEDEEHAGYMYDMEGIYNYEGHTLRYVDNIEEITRKSGQNNKH